MNRIKSFNNNSPICVDLDGTLTKTDLLFETAIDAIRKQWSIIFRIPLWLLKGKAHAKSQLAKVGNCNLEIIPWNEELIGYLKKEKENGRTIVLATASDSSIAVAVVRHLGIFDDVIASDGVINIKGEEKSKVLLERYGKHGFTYAGNDNSDLHVWKIAKTALVVNSTRNISAAVAKLVPIEHEFGSRKSVIFGLMKGCRIYQWIKNILIFVPLIAAHRIFEKAAVLPSLLTFASFCAAASGIYLINDLLDLDADRQHPRKRFRPFASGDLPLAYGIMGPFLVAIAIAIGLNVSNGILTIIITYISLSLAYTNYFKTKPLVDVFCLAALYTLRVVAGGVASRSLASVWLMNFSGFLFLSLGFLKRYAEYSQSNMIIAQTQTRRGYIVDDSSLIIIMGVSSSFISSLVLGLYVNSEQAHNAYKTPSLLWIFLPLILFWQCRMWLATIRGSMHDDPIIFASKDWVSHVVLIICVVIYLLATVQLNLNFLFK